MPYYIAFTIFLLLMLIGLVGLVVPILPSIPFMFIVALVFAAVGKFSHISVGELVILGIIVALSFFVDYFSGIFGAKYGGAGAKTILAGAIGMVIGLIFFPPLGGFIGLFIGVFVSELILWKNHIRALKVASGSLIGSVIGLIINVILALTFLTLFVVFAF